ncbi:MAG: extracellular solute-binding protein [Alphaproteobacteria bacterium]|nr:extracellular solute-binding protein [Alphaproteobacteria bacterium]
MIKRRAFMQRIASTTSGLAVFGAVAIAWGTASVAQELHVLNWKGWGTDETFAIESFKSATGAKLVHDYITSYPEVFTKLRTNPGYYDVVILNAAFVGQAVAEGLIDPVDTPKLSNYPNLFAEIRESSQVKFDGKPFAVPWIWGATSVTYDTNAFPTPPTSLAVLWDPANAKKVCWRDDPEDSVRFAALALGQNPDKPEDMKAIREKLRALKPQIKAFWKSEDEWRKLFAAKECIVSIFWSSSTERAIARDKLPVSYIVATEGAIAFRDTLVFPKGSRSRELAQKFVDYLTGPEFYGDWRKGGGAPVSANAKVMEGLPEGTLSKKVLATPEGMKRINFKGPLSDAQRQSYLDLWQETKAYFAQ